MKKSLCVIFLLCSLFIGEKLCAEQSEEVRSWAYSKLSELTQADAIQQALIDYEDSKTKPDAVTQNTIKKVFQSFSSGVDGIARLQLYNRAGSLLADFPEDVETLSDQEHQFIRLLVEDREYQQTGSYYSPAAGAFFILVGWPIQSSGGIDRGSLLLKLDAATFHFNE